MAARNRLWEEAKFTLKLYPQSLIHALLSCRVFPSWPTTCRVRCYLEFVIAFARILETLPDMATGGLYDVRLAYKPKRLANLRVSNGLYY